MSILQGEDVVAGIRTPQELDAMKQCMPDAYKELVENCNILELHYKDMMVRFFFFFKKKKLNILILHSHCFEVVLLMFLIDLRSSLLFKIFLIAPLFNALNVYYILLNYIGRMLFLFLFGVKRSLF